MSGFLGRTHSTATRARLSIVQKGRPKSSAHRAKIGAATARLWEDPEHRAIFVAAAHTANLRHRHYCRGVPKPTYQSWGATWKRCRNPNDKDVKNYGARGITVCDSWRRFEHFLADMGERPEVTTLDRKDNDRGPFKENCRWATPLDQRHTRRDI